MIDQDEEKRRLSLRRLRPAGWLMATTIIPGLLATQLPAACASDIDAQSPSENLRSVRPVDITVFPQPRPFRDRPPVPVRVLPQDVAEPPRTVRANEWRSPYCTEWTDGREVCERANAGARARCRQLPPAVAATKRHPVACLMADLDRLSLVCWRYALMDPGEPIPHWRNRTERQRSSGILRQENWIWNAKARQWRESGGEDDAIGNYPRIFLPRQGIHSEVANLRTYYCFRTYQEPIPWRDMSPGALQ